MRLLVILALTILFVQNNSYARICFSLKPATTDTYKFRDDITISSWDGTQLAANIFIPHISEVESLPAVVFINSWSMDEHEYIRQAKLLANKGYIVLSYSTRGFGCSGGVVDVAGPNDMKDISSVIDWLIANTNTDEGNIGFAGISYGAGLTLMGMAHDDRIKTGVAMSGWSSLTEALYANQTPRKFWTSLLILTGYLAGKIPRELPQMFKDILIGKNVESTMRWTELRSPINFIDKINNRQAPVYISQNFGDNLFQPNPIIKFYNKLKGPKLLDLNQGSHATGEASGLLTNNNFVFKRLHKWFDYWLKGKANKEKLGGYSLQLDIEHEREFYSQGEINVNKYKKYFLGPRALLGAASMGEDFYSGRDETNTIISGIDTTASTGIPLLSAIIDGNFKIAPFTYMPLVNKVNAIRFKGPRLEQALRLRGSPKLKLNVAAKKRMQLIAYLYDMNRYGHMKLITHGAFSTDKGIDHSRSINFDLVATAYNVNPGHRLVLIIDTKDSLYAAKGLIPQKIKFSFDQDNQMELELPLYENLKK